ncbi:hypothetical protein SEA_TINALIN_61 [Gordonia phage TinaLin]|uniref:Uncharacterized protein n=1 Tax=Gordonia phage TinaLin TaxID=2797324 RepID=A0A7T7GTZ1_9CAUD|nr:hypothetical protein KDJ60_gp45 [Gordonia phage TinaLin]QQM15149.1 hypothetical protein SEA_TINALIN_61 [Gordonia phage TinaLin]
MPRKDYDRDRVIICESFRDAEAFKRRCPEYADWSPVSIPTIDYRLKGRHLQDFRLTSKVAARAEAPLIESSCRFLVALYGIGDNRGDLAHYRTLDELVKPAPDSKDTA